MHSRIREARKEKFTQKEFAAALGVTDVYVNMIENGKKEPSQRLIKYMCAILEINETWLLTGEGEKYVKKTKEAQIAEMTTKLYNEDDPFRIELVNMLVNASDDQLKLLKEVATVLAGKIKDHE